MLLNRTAHRIGYLGSMKSWDQKKVDSLNQFLDYLILHLNYNSNRGIRVFCVDSQDIDFEKIDFSQIEEDSLEQEKIDIIFNFLSFNKSRLFFFISKSYFLGSQIPEVVDQTKGILSKISSFLDLVGFQEPSILVRVGSAYGNRKETLSRFCLEVESLPESISSRLIVVNDEKPSLFSVTDLLAGVFYTTKTPICFRFLPHQFNDGGLTSREALFLSSSTWPVGVKPLFIYSEAESTDDLGFPVSPTPSEYLGFRIPTFNLEIDVVLDSGGKDLTCTKYMQENKSLKPIVINRAPE
jgi:UV DNA damage repair endonuclease